jgi:hypothetical protein
MVVNWVDMMVAETAAEKDGLLAVWMVVLMVAVSAVQ